MFFMFVPPTYTTRGGGSGGLTRCDCLICRTVGLLVIKPLRVLNSAKANLQEDLPIDTKSNWINEQNKKLNQIPMCSKRKD